MASITDLLIQGAQQTVSQTPNYAASLAQGAELAQNLERLKMQREQIEQQKVQAREQKLENMTNDIMKARSLGGKALSGYKEFLKNKSRVLGLEDVYTPEAIDLVTSTPDNLDRLSVLTSKIQRGEVDLQSAIGTLQDQGLWYELNPAEKQQLQEAQKFQIEEQNKMQRAEAEARASLGKQIQAQQAAGQVELSKDVAKKYSEYTAAGGKAGMDSALSKLENAAKALETGVVKTGKLSNVIPGFSSDAVQSMLNPKLLEVRTEAQSALNTVLRATLGAQFTQQEGERILNQIWDDKLSPTANSKKIRAKINELRSGVKNAESEFTRFNYMTPAAGAKAPGKAPKGGADETKPPGNAFAPNAGQKAAFKALTEDQKTIFVEGIMKMYKMGRDEVLSVIGGK